MTSRSTVGTLIVSGQLRRWTAPTTVEGARLREAYYSSAWSGFLARLPDAPEKGLERARSMTPAAQLRRFLDAYASGESPKNVDDYGLYPSWKVLNDHCWEIRAGITRNFGWFVRPNVVVLVDGALKGELLDRAGREIDARYRAFGRLVADWRTARGLMDDEVSHEKDHRKLIT